MLVCPLFSGLGCKIKFVNSAFFPVLTGAVDMCDILMETTQDSYLMELCSNITHTQRAEITWMSQWLEARDMAVRAPCDQNCSSEAVPFAPREDTLSTSSFCHGIAGQLLDGYCCCNEATFNTNGYSCGVPTWVEGLGLFVPKVLCQRTCGKCSSSERPLWVPACGEGSQHHDIGSDSHGNNSHDDHDVLKPGDLLKVSFLALICWFSSGLTQNH